MTIEWVPSLNFIDFLLRYHSDFDSNGIIHWLGAEGGHGGDNFNPEPWRHPLNLLAEEQAESRVVCNSSLVFVYLY